MKAIATNKAPSAIGPYSQGIDTGTLVFSSGQIALGPEGGDLPEGIEAQTKKALENVKAVLEAGGTSLAKVVKVTVFIKNMDQFAKVNEIYATYFTGTFPARSCVEVARLPKDALVEIEAIAVK